MRPPPRASLEREKVLGWPRRCGLAHAFLWEHSCKKLKLAQLLGQRGVFLTCGDTQPGGWEGPARREGGGGIRPEGDRQELGAEDAGLRRGRLDGSDVLLRSRSAEEVAAEVGVAAPQPVHGAVDRERC